MALLPRKLTDSDTCRQSWVMLFLSLARAGGREGQRKRNRRERQIRSLCEIARPGFKFGESSPLGNIHVLFPTGTSGCDGQGRGGPD